MRSPLVHPGRVWANAGPDTARNAMARAAVTIGAGAVGRGRLRSRGGSGFWPRFSGWLTLRNHCLMATAMRAMTSRSSAGS